jgi:hypothetical protein
MTYQEWQKNGWLKPHQTSAPEVAGLRAVVERDLKASADEHLDGDWRFAIAYNAALQCAALALKAAGYEVPKGGGMHYHTVESLRLTWVVLHLQPQPGQDPPGSDRSGKDGAFGGETGDASEHPGES